MNIAKKIAISATAFMGVATLGVSALYAAQTPVTPRADRMSGLVQALATKFQLNATDVQQVFDQQHQEMQQKMLDKAVTDGKLTQAQADLVKVKQVEMKAAFERMKTLPEAERKTEMKAQHEAFKAWLKTNNIPEASMRFMQGPGHGGKHGGMMRKGEFRGMNR